jgi:hypothetical protein
MCKKDLPKQSNEKIGEEGDLERLETEAFPVMLEPNVEAWMNARGPERSKGF